MKIVLRIRRFDPETDREPHDEDYPVEVEPTERILDALIRVKDEQDGSLSFRRSCAPRGVRLRRHDHRRGGAAGLQDPRPGRGSRRMARSSPSSPCATCPVQRDLMVDQAVFFQKFKLVKPFLINGEPVKEKERIQSQAERAAFDDATSCILCGACYSSCPVLEKNASYVGPAALVQAARFIFDSRDRGLPERMSVLDGPDGAAACENHFNCTRVCPRGIKVTKNINATKRLLAKVKEGSA